jgi:hypothetical protein
VGSVGKLRFEVMGGLPSQPLRLWSNDPSDKDAVTAPPTVAQVTIRRVSARIEIRTRSARCSPAQSSQDDSGV